MVQTPRDAIETEFVSYYNGDEMPAAEDLDVAERAAGSAMRIRELAGDEGAGGAAALLREMAEDRGHPLTTRIVDTSLYDWTGDEESWHAFQRLVRTIADELER
jgi:hypothetical protein